MSLISDLRPDINWNDEERVSVLYAPFRPKELSPQAWDAKMIFWKDVIKKWIISNRTSCFSQKQLEESLSYNNRSLQYVIPTVINDLMTCTKEIKKLNELQDEWKLKHSSWSEWTVNVAKKGATGLLHSIWSKQSSEPIFVHIQTLQANAKKALDRLNRISGVEVKKNKFISRTQLLDIFSTAEEMDLIIDYLKSIEKCDTCSVNDVIYIKLSEQKSFVQKVSEDDLNLLKLHILSKSILSEIKNLESSVSGSKKSIKEHLKAGSRTQAKYELKRMKRVQTTLEKKLIVLNNLESIIDSVESASSQINVMQAYKAGAMALKNELHKNDTPESAAKTLDDVNYYMNEVKEISDILSTEVFADTSEDQLNEELEMLLKEENKQEELINSLTDLEIVSHEPEMEGFDDQLKINKKLTDFDYSA